MWLLHRKKLLKKIGLFQIYHKIGASSGEEVAELLVYWMMKI